MQGPHVRGWRDPYNANPDGMDGDQVREVYRRAEGATELAQGSRSKLLSPWAPHEYG